MSWKDNLTKIEQLTLRAGKWQMEFLDNGTPYTFERGGKSQDGVSFEVNAKNLDTMENYPSVKWGITAKSVLKHLAIIDDLVGWKLKLDATGEGLNRRYPNIETIAPKKQTKL